MNIKRIAAALLAGAMLLPAAEVFAQKDSTGTEITGWFFSKKNTDASVTLVDDESFSGKNSIHITNNTPANGDQNYLRIHNEIKLPESGRYKFGCYIKTKNAGRTTMFLKSSMPSIVPFTKTRDWQKFEFIYDAAAPMSDWLGFMIFDKCDDIWIDDVFIYRVDEDGNQISENYVHNSSFEENAASGKKQDVSDDDYYYADDDPNTAEGYLARSKTVPVCYSDRITIDADLSDWSEIPAVHISGLTNYGNVPVDNDANMRYAYDDNNFYFAIETEDKTHCADDAKYWRCDGIQVMLSSKPGMFGTEIGVVLKDDGSVFRTHEDINTQVRRAGTKTIYETSVPWGQYIPGSPQKFSFNAIVNNNDGDGRVYCLEIAPGISKFKSGAYAPVLDFLPRGQKYYGMIKGNSTATMGDTQDYEFSLINWGEDKEFSIDIPSADIKKNVNVKSGSIEKINYSEKMNTLGAVKQQALCNEVPVTFETTVYPDDVTFNKYIQGFKNDITDIERLMESCNKKGISTNYEKSYTELIKRSVEVMQDKKNSGDMSVIPYNLNAVRKIIDSTKADLKGYLNGTKKEKVTSNYVASPVSYSGKSFYAQAVTAGKTEQRPVFFLGYNSGWEGRDERSNWSKFGANIAGEGKMFSDIVGTPSWPNLWSINPRGDGLADADLIVKDSIGYQSSCGLEITNRSSMAADNKGSYLWQGIKLKPNTKYNYGYKVKGKNISGMSIAIETFHNCSGSYDDWTSMDYSFTTNEAPDYTILQIRLPDSAEGVCIDDVYLREDKSDVNMLKNGSFEEYYKPLEGTEFGINQNALAEFKKSVQRNEYNNTATLISLTLHSVPGIVKQNPKYQGNGTGFLPYGLENDYILGAIRVMLEQILPISKEYDSPFIIYTANEPEVNANAIEYYTPSWQRYLKEKYGDIKTLNKVYGASYANFEKVAMPKQYSDSVLYYDYRVFNESLTEAYFENIYKMVKEINPDIMVTNKFMIDLCTTESNTIGTAGTSRGINFGRLYKSSDIAGNDAWAYMGSTSATLQAKLEWYDFQSDIAGTPVINMEDHIILDNAKMDYSEDLPAWYYANIWQGAMHGLGADTVWLWGRSDQMENGAFSNTTVQYRADCMVLTSKIGKDLNRLSKEVAAIKDRKADAALLYSHPSRSYESYYMNSLYNAYNAMLSNGVKPFFLSDEQMEKLIDYDMLIVPEAVHVKSGVLDAILDFVKRGGKLYIIGENSLQMDENNVPLDKIKVETVKSMAQILPSASVNGEFTSGAKDTADEFLTKAFSDNSKIKVAVKDAKTGERLKNIDCVWTEYDGKYIVNICNYDWEETKYAVIETESKQAENMTDLLELSDIHNEIELKPYIPVMVAIEK